MKEDLTVFLYEKCESVASCFWTEPRYCYCDQSTFNGKKCGNYLEKEILKE